MTREELGAEMGLLHLRLIHTATAIQELREQWLQAKNKQDKERMMSLETKGKEATNQQWEQLRCWTKLTEQLKELDVQQDKK